MKKRLFFMTLPVLIFSSFLKAQNVSFGVQAGVTIASMKAEYSGISITSDSKIGFTIGGLADIPIGESFSFQPGLNFTQKGGKYSVEGDEAKLTLNYLELPLNFLYTASTGSGKFFGGIGPVLGYGISGKGKYKEAGMPEISADIEFGSDELEDDYKPFEFSGNILAGYELSNGLFLAVNYNLGLSDISVGDDEDSSEKNRYFGIRIGYKFNKNK